MAHGSTHVALSTRAECTASTEAESTTSARRLRPLSFCPDSLEGFTAYPRYFEQRNYVTYRTTPPAYHRYFEQRNYVTYRTVHLATGSTTQLIAPCTLHLAPCTLHNRRLITQLHATGSTAQLITQHLARRTTQRNSLIEEFHRKCQTRRRRGFHACPR